MKYIPSINIESGIYHEFQYIVTPNAKEVLGNIVSPWFSGLEYGNEITIENIK